MTNFTYPREFNLGSRKLLKYPRTNRKFINQAGCEIKNNSNKKNI